jgi:hypothetical protein
MNPKNTWMLVALAAGLFAFIYFFERHMEPPAAAVARVLPHLDTNEVTSIEIHPRDQFVIRVERTNGGWQLTKPIAYPVRNAAVDAFLSALAELSPIRRISPEELQNNKKAGQEFGFDAPQTTIDIEQGDDVRHLQLGNATVPGDGVYAQEVAGKDGVDIIPAGFAAYVPTKAGQWRDTTFVNLQGLPFVELDVNGANGQLKFQRDDPNKPWVMLFPSKGARADSEKINDLLDRLQNLRVSKFETDDSNADLEPFGLQSPQLVLTFKDKNTNQLLSLQFGKSPANYPDQAYARTNSSSTIVWVPREDLKPWSAESSNFRDQHLVSLTVAEPPASVECYGPDGRTNFIVQKINDMLIVTNGEGLFFRAEPGAVNNVITNLAEMTVVPWSADRFADDAVTESELPGMGLAPNPVSRYVLRGLPVGGTLPVIAQVDFGLPNTNQEGTVCARRSDLSESSVFAVNRSDLDRLPTSAVQLRLHAIWNFNATNASHLTVQARGKTREWDHDREFTWIPKGGGFTTRDQGMFMENFVNTLGSLTAESWIGPGEPTKEHGFDTNAYQFSVTLTNAGPPLTLTVTFGGKVSGGGGAVYACTPMERGQNWLFVYSAKDVEYLNNYLPPDTN